MRVTVLSDTHTIHNLIPSEVLPGGELLIHAGDFMNSGRRKEDVVEFCKWFSSQTQYDTKVFVAGNHDRMFEDFPEQAMEIVNSYKDIDYLQDDTLTLYFDGPNGDYYEDSVNIYGSPWQPEFYNWAFNLPKNSKELGDKWRAIPTSTDILITHCPPMHILDTSGKPYNQSKLGCKLLEQRVAEIQPKIHIFGHIHGSYGYVFKNGTHFINASVLNERYEYTNKPITFNWDKQTNIVEFHQI